MSSEQRERIVDALVAADEATLTFSDENWSPDFPALADAVLPFIEEARRAERERVTRIIRDLKDAALTYGAPGRDQHVQLVAFENVLLALGVEDNQPGTTP